MVPIRLVGAALCIALTVALPSGGLAQSAGGTKVEAGKKKAEGARPKASKLKRQPPTVVTPPAPFVPTPGFAVKPAEVVGPADVPLGQYRRVIWPFPNWTLICDENLAKKQKVCNIAQTILGPDGTTAFSWSLAASQDGLPIFILRAPAMVGEGGSIRLDLHDGGAPVEVSIAGCTGSVCLGYQPVGQRLRNAVTKELVIDVSFARRSEAAGPPFRVPLGGLAMALAAI